MLDSNWYVLKVNHGDEEKAVEEILNKVPSTVINNAFIPKYKKLFKFKKKWEKRDVPLFSGYVFLETDDIVELFKAMRTQGLNTFFIGKDDDFVHPIYLHEKNALLKYINDSYTVDISTGYIVNDRIVVTEGPLLGQEGSITKIDRHKRVAWVSFEFLGQTVNMQVGLEIIDKIEE